MHGIGLGQSDFRALRIRKNYYIDKTMYIKDIIDNDSSVILVTRPRRFGKTLNNGTRRRIHFKIRVLSMYIFNAKRYIRSKLSKYDIKLKDSSIRYVFRAHIFIR